jgi:Cu2+-exporting ATPase
MKEDHSMHGGMKHDGSQKGMKGMQGMQHGASGHAMQGHMMHTGMFKTRFFVCLALTIPVLILSQAIQTWFHYTLTVPYQSYILLILAVIIYAYGGWPFLKGLTQELRRAQPGMIQPPPSSSPSERTSSGNSPRL